MLAVYESNNVEMMIMKKQFIQPQVRYIRADLMLMLSQSQDPQPPKDKDFEINDNTYATEIW